MIKSRIKHPVVERLEEYRQALARIKVLSSYSVGAGITISRLNEDDHLQQLHRKLRGRPSYLYLTKREQQLETVAHAHLTEYPAGTKAQLAAIPEMGIDPEDDHLLQELRRKIQKIIDSRQGLDDGFSGVLNRLAALQDLQTEVRNVELVLENCKPEYVELLKLRYVEQLPVDNVAARMHITRRTYARWLKEALCEFERLSH